MQHIANAQLREILSENLRALMGGFSQAILRDAELKTKISKRTLAYFVQKSGNPTLETLTDIANAYRISLSALLAKNLGKTNETTIDPGAASLKVAELIPHPYSNLAMQLAELADQMNDNGKWELIGTAKVLARLHPKPKANHE